MVTKYSKFVSFPLYMNGRRLNTLQVRPGCLQAQVAVEMSRSTSGWRVRGGTGRCCQSSKTGCSGRGEICGCRQLHVHQGVTLHSTRFVLLSVFSHAAVTMVGSRTFHPQKETPRPSAVTPTPRPWPLATSPLSGLAYSGRFIKMESTTVWPCVSSFLLCFQGLCWL